MESKKQETQETELTYEQELKALKEKWNARKKEQAKAKKEEANKEKKEKAKEFVKQAIEILYEVDIAYARELAPVTKRLYMFINDEKYTRNKGGND